MRWKSLAVLLFAAACSSGGNPLAGLDLGLGGPVTRGWPVTYENSTYGFAFICKSGDICTEQARAACRSAYQVRRLEEIDRTRSRLAVEGGLFGKLRAGRIRLAVSCK